MRMTTTTTTTGTAVPQTADQELLGAVEQAVRRAGAAVLERFDDARPAPRSLTEIRSALGANDSVVLATLRDDLLRARPGSGWVEDEAGTGPLPDGEWWVSDPVEGNINHAHGMDDWMVTATLIRDNEPVLTAVHEPVRRRTYTAVRGAGAFVESRAIRTSTKTDLGAALVGTGQALPGEGLETYRRIGASVTAMLTAALVLRVSVPATAHLTQVAAGRMDAFWQHSRVRSGLAAGALLVSESGGVVTDLAGTPWTFASPDFLAAAPGVHAAALAELRAPQSEEHAS